MRGFLRNPRFSPHFKQFRRQRGENNNYKCLRDVITVRVRLREFASLFPHTEGEAGPPWEATFPRQIFSEHCK